MPQESKVRLQKFMAECGVASRRGAEELIRAGKVLVNGRAVTQLGTRVDPQRDRVVVDGELLRQKEGKIYIKLHKPRGYLSSCRSQFGEKTILDLVKNAPSRLYPVGRLDKDSEGLIILTNDGELADRLTHPRYEHEKEYLVNVQLPISNDQLRSFQSGIVIEGQKTLPAKVRRIGEGSFSIVLREGKKRQIRRMVEAVGNRVIKLIRIRIGNIRLGPLPPGKYVYLTSSEIRGLML